MFDSPSDTSKRPSVCLAATHYHFAITESDQTGKFINLLSFVSSWKLTRSSQDSRVYLAWAIYATVPFLIAISSSIYVCRKPNVFIASKSVLAISAIKQNQDRYQHVKLRVQKHRYTDTHTYRQPEKVIIVLRQHITEGEVLVLWAFSHTLHNYPMKETRQ